MNRRIFWVALLTPAFLLSLTALMAPAKSTAISQPYFHQMKMQLKGLTGSKSQDQAQAYFDDLRRSFKALEWTLLPLRDQITPEEVNNSKYWVWQDEMFHKNYEEAGILQTLEKLLEQATLEPAKIGLLSTSFQAFIKKWEHKYVAWRPRPTEIICAIAVDMQQQYILTLSGQDRLATDKSLGEFIAVIDSYQSTLKSLSLAQVHTFLQQSYLTNLKQAIQHQSFDELDRVDLYLTHILPSSQRLLKIAWQIDKEFPSWASHLNLSQPNIFLKGGLNATYFSELEYQEDLESLINLGQLLFFDPLLSGNNKRSCASCHKPSRAFSDGRQTSMGFDISKRVMRNSPSLLNTTYNLAFSHDMAKSNLAEQTISVIYHHQEFRSSTKSIVQKLKSSAQYQKLFSTCFPNTLDIDSTQVFTALTAYMEDLQDFDSPFDQYMQGQSKSIDKAVLAGYNLFMGKAMCGSCHFPPLYSGLKPMAYQNQEYHSHGVSAHLLHPNRIDPDPGLQKNDSYGKYKYIYKTPSLRNIAITGPYMHNGIFPELNQALDYIFSGQQAPSITASLPAGSLYRLSNKERSDIRTFLNSLTTTKLERFQKEIALPMTNDSLALNRRRAGGMY